MISDSPDLEFVVKWSHKTCNDLPCLKNHTSVLYKNKIIIFGGYDGVNNLNIVFLYDTEKDEGNIQMAIGDVPKGRNGHTATIFENKMYVIGGWLGAGQLASDEIYELDLDGFIWRKIDSDPGPANMHSADLYGEEIIIFKLMICRQLEVTGKLPHVRANHGSAIIGHNLYIFGGWSGTKRLNDLFTINLQKLQWCQIEYSGHKPSPRAGMPLINYKNYLMLFGGSGSNSIYLNDLYFFDTLNNTWIIPNKTFNLEELPCIRAGHTAVMKDKSIFFFGGGKNSNSSLNDVNILEIDPQPPCKSIKFSTKDRMFENLKIYYNNPFLCDIIIVMENSDSIFYAHKFVLSILCEKFRAMFSYGFEENINQVLHIRYHFKHFEVILKYLYFGDIDDLIGNDWFFSDFTQLLNIADEYLLEEVKNWAQVKLIKIVDVNNFHYIDFFAKKFSAEMLIQYCHWYCRHHKNSIANASVGLDLSELSINDTFKGCDVGEI